MDQPTRTSLSGDATKTREHRLPQGSANLLSAALNKQVTTIRIADQRARTILTINAFLIPLVLSQIDNPRCTQAGPAFVALAFLSISCALFGLLQNKIKIGPSDTHPGLFHFSSIHKMKEADYLEAMQRVLHKNNGLEMHIAHDIYHLSHDILRPKFRWIRASYLLFVTGLIGSGLLFLTAPYRL